MFKNRGIENRRTNVSNIYETAAKQYLVKHGMKPLTNNYRCRAGEIDLVMCDADTLVFIEVRFRKNQLFGGGAASVIPAKQRKLIRAARHYLHANRYTGDCRFDVVDVTYAQHNATSSGADTALQFNWIKNAFLTK